MAVVISGRARALTLGVLVIALLLAGCGGAPQSAGSPASAAAAASPSASAPPAAAGAATSSSTQAAASSSTVSATSGVAATTITAHATTATSPTAAGDVAAGRALFVSNGCVACHGDNAEGKIGPKIAGTGLSFAEVLHQVRQPRGQMPPFSAQQVSDAQVQQIYAYLESLAPPTPTPAPAASTAASATGAAAKPVNVDAVVGPVDDFKVASDYAKDASKTVGDVHHYGNQAATALKAAQAAVQTAITSGGGSAELQADLNQLRQELDSVAPDVQAAVAATALAEAQPHTAKMVLASRLDLLPLALELVRVNGEVGSVTGVVKDTAGNPVPQALVTIEGGKVHTGLLTDANGAFKASGIAAFKTIEVKAYKAGYLYVESHAPVSKDGTANVVITIPVENHPDASPKVSDATVPAGTVVGTASIHLAMSAVQQDNNIAEDQLWALSPQAGVAYVLRSTGNNQYALDQALPGLKPGAYSWYFFATTHECDMSNVIQQQMTVQ